MKTFTTQLNWRFATKIFDKEKKIKQEDLDIILEAIRLAPSSMGLQPFHVFVISDKKLREDLKKLSFGQSQVTDSAYLLIFCARNDINVRIDKMIDLISDNNEKIKEGLSGFKEMLINFTLGKSKEELMNWSARQTYLALGFGLAACAELGIDSTPMEGFDPEAIHKKLNLPENIFPVAYMAVGYRKEGPIRKKFRFPKDELFTIDRDN